MLLRLPGPADAWCCTARRRHVVEALRQRPKMSAPLDRQITCPRVAGVLW